MIETNEISRYFYEIANTTELSNQSNFVTECNDFNCIYNRNTTNIRKYYEDKIVSVIDKTKKNKIMFFNCYCLKQELLICNLLKDSIDEIHLVDDAYNNFYTNYECYLALEQFSHNIFKIDPKIRIFFHSSTDLLIHNKKITGQIDIICGIDIEYLYSKVKYCNVMKMVACNVLKYNGIMVVSHHIENLVDICTYCLHNCNDNPVLKLSESINYVKKIDFLKYYFLTLIVTNIRYILILLLLFLILTTFICGISPLTSLLILYIIMKLMTTKNNTLGYTRKIYYFDKLYKI